MSDNNARRNDLPRYNYFGRLFPNLDAAPDDDKLAQEIGRPFGPMHSSGQGGNPRLPAGFTYLGQFIDHDLMFDPTLSLEPKHNQEPVRNFRTSAFDLDSVYALGPSANPYLYNSRDPRKLLVENRGQDLPRLDNEIAVIGDPRNDENVIVSQLLAAILNFHNEVIDQENRSFEETRQLVRWHYQWIALHEYLPAITGRSVDDILQNSAPRFWQASEQPFTPFEFSLAAFRFGHGQIRRRYDVNSNVQGKGRLILPDLGGRRRLKANDRIEWQFFFEMGNGHRPQPSLPIQPFLAPPLLSLPREMLGPRRPARGDFELSLAYRDIRRGQLHRLPDGHAVAKKLGIQKVVSADLIWEKTKERLERSGSNYDPYGKPVPLWFYILFEAQEFANGEHLGPVAARIISDVFVGLLKGDPESFLSKKPDWRPTLGANPGKFGIADLLRIAEKQKARFA
jgi:hypothetical protein